MLARNRRPSILATPTGTNERTCAKKIFKSQNMLFIRYAQLLLGGGGRGHNTSFPGPDSTQVTLPSSHPTIDEWCNGNDKAARGHSPLYAVLCSFTNPSFPSGRQPNPLRAANSYMKDTPAESTTGVSLCPPFARGENLSAFTHPASVFRSSRNGRERQGRRRETSLRAFAHEASS